ncbi:MAG: AbgT family transporter [Bacilli bacterium]|nr:AbgT family transporter [Bacilli bacterium]
MKKKKRQKNIKGPVSTILFLIFLISISSLVLSLLGFQGNKTYIGDGTLETSLVYVNNIISLNGIKFIVGNVVTNFVNFKPLAIMIISLVGIGILEKSGLLNAMVFRLKNVKFDVIIYFTVFIGIISSIIGEYSYMFLIPFMALIYKYLNRSPILGILVTFIGITIGYGTGIIFNYDDYQLGILTQASATLNVDPNYKYDLLSNIYIMIFSTLLLSFISTIVINKFLVVKFPKKEMSLEIEELNYSKKGVIIANLVSLICIILVIYMILDIKLPGAGILLNSKNDTYISKLFGTSSPFREGIVIIITFIMMISGFVYGKISKNIKNSHEYSLGLSKNFENLGFVFVLMFFTSVMISILEWTNIGTVISANIVEFISSIPLSGIPLIIIFMLAVIVMSILIPDTITKWKLLSPTVIPLFMRANITPDFTQFIFRIADGIGKSVTPFFAYFIIMLAFLEKYKKDENVGISIFGTFKLLSPVILILSIFLILFIVIWYIIGIPIGIGVGSTI